MSIMDGDRGEQPLEEDRGVGEWRPTMDLRWFDDTPKLVDTRLQQRWSNQATGASEWRVIQFVHERPKHD